MIKLQNILKEVTGRTLHVYDFDDTLVKTDTPIIVIDDEGNTRELSSHEFAVYQKLPGEEFDFSKFDAAIRASQPILKNLKQIITSLKNPSIKTTVLTARRLAFPIMKHLRDKYGVNVYVVGVGSSNPEDKADWIEKQVLKGYTNIKFIDDSQKNLDAVQRRLSKYDNINLELINALH
jgi:HAD superfamily hydrolase (TIGR01509 family)